MCIAEAVPTADDEDRLGERLLEVLVRRVELVGARIQAAAVVLQWAAGPPYRTQYIVDTI